MSITKVLKSRIVNTFNQIQVVASETEIVAGHLRNTTEQLAQLQRYHGVSESEHTRILDNAVDIEGRIGDLSKQLESLVVGLRDVTQIQYFIGKFFSDLLTRFQILVNKWEESGEITDDIRDDIAKLATLLMNVEIFLNDPDELAMLLSTIDSKTLDIAIEKVRGRSA
jgi:hypothetical protein